MTRCPPVCTHFFPLQIRASPDASVFSRDYLDKGICMGKCGKDAEIISLETVKHNRHIRHGRYVHLPREEGPHGLFATAVFLQRNIKTLFCKNTPSPLRYKREQTRTTSRPPSLIFSLILGDSPCPQLTRKQTPIARVRTAKVAAARTGNFLFARACAAGPFFSFFSIIFMLSFSVCRSITIPVVFLQCESVTFFAMRKCHPPCVIF